MIEIEQRRKLHDSGYRLMTITYSNQKIADEVMSKGADVLHIGFNDWLDGIHLDITRKGIIRIWSNNYELEPVPQCGISDVFFMVKPKNKGAKQ